MLVGKNSVMEIGISKTIMKYGRDNINLGGFCTQVIWEGLCRKDIMCCKRKKFILRGLGPGSETEKLTILVVL